jgi:phosphocarrier protein HPr
MSTDDGDLFPNRPQTGESISCTLQIVNKKGLHARASAKFVQTVEGYDAAVTVTRCGETVGGTSIMGLMMLAAATGTKIVVEASGAEATAVIAALTQLVGSGFGEED